MPHCAGGDNCLDVDRAVKNNPKANIFHQSIKAFDTQKFEFRQFTAKMPIRQSRPVSGPVEVVPTIGGDYGGIEGRSGFQSDDMPQSGVKRPSSTAAIRRGKFNRTDAFESRGFGDVDTTHISSFGGRAGGRVTASLSTTTFPMQGRVDHTASNHSVMHSHAIAQPSVSSQISRTMAAGAQQEERDPVTDSRETRAPESRDPVLDVAGNGANSTSSKFDRGHLVDSNSIGRSPTAGPRVIACSARSDVDNGFPSSLSGRLRNSDPSKATIPGQPDLSKAYTGPASRSDPGLVGGATNTESSDAGESTAARRGSSGTGGDTDRAAESSGVAGELWLDAVSLRNWFQAYLAGETARNSRATKQPNVAFGHW
jgi:hypothetical protein